MTNDLSIRPAQAGDAPAILKIYAPIVRETAISFEVDVPSVEEMAERIAAFSASHVYLTAKRAGQLIGYAYASPHRSRATYQTSADVTVYVDSAARGLGVGTALYRALLPAIAAKGFHAAFAGITLPNDGSVALHESVGFTHVGVYREVGYKLGQWRDVGWWQRLLIDER